MHRLPWQRRVGLLRDKAALYASTMRFLSENIEKVRRLPIRRACVVFITALVDQQDWLHMKDVTLKDPSWREVNARAQT